MIKKLLSHSLIYSLAPQAPKIASLFLMPIITKHLTTVDYGIYGVITSYLFFVTVLKDLGFGVVFVNTFYKHPNRWKLIWRMLHGHLIIWGLIYSVLLLLALRIAIPKEAYGNYWSIAALLIIPAILFETTNSIGNYYYRFSQKPVYIAIVSIVTGVLSVFMTYYCIVTLHMGYMGWFVASFVSILVMFLFYVYPVYIKLKLIPLIRFRKKFITPHLRVALPMIPHNYSSYLLNSSDRVVMNVLKINISQIGLYNIAYTFGNYFETVGEAVGMAVGPFYSKLYSSKKPTALRDERRLTFFLASCFIAATFLLSLWLREVFMLLIGNKELQAGYSIGIIIIMSYAYRPMYWSAGIKLSMFEKTSLLWRISFIAGMINVILNFIFIPYFGIYAAAANTMVSLLYMGFSGYYFKSYKKMEGLDHYPLYWIAVIMLLTLVSYLLKDAWIPVKIMITAGIVIAGAALLIRNIRGLKEIDV
jgi:O-antigen/teichoic acid export membrane protein